MDPEKANHIRWDEMEWEEVVPGIRRRMIWGEGMMIAQIHLAQGAVVPRHSHENEQITYILEGALRLRLGERLERTVVVHAGEVLHIPANLPHDAVALEETLDVDVFHPPRADWIDGSDAYFRAGGGTAGGEAATAGGEG